MNAPYIVDKLECSILHDKQMYFAKDKIETMEKEHKAKNEAWIKEMTEKINIAKNNIDEMKKVDSLDDLKKQLEILKSSISTFGDSNNAEISSLQVCLNLIHGFLYGDPGE